MLYFQKIKETEGIIGIFRTTLFDINHIVMN